MFDRIIVNIVRKIEERFPNNNKKGEWVWVGYGPNPFKD